jgi:lipopolysaccharide export system protein LptA
LGLIALPGLATPAGGETEIVIKSKSVEFDNQAKVVTYIGDVEARQQDIVVTCQRLLAYFDDQSKTKSTETKSTEKNDFKINKIVAKTNVVMIRQTDGMTLNCDEAIFYQDEDKIEAFGKPAVIKQNRNVTESSKFTLYQKTNRVIGDGDTVTHIYRQSN